MMKKENYEGLGITFAPDNKEKQSCVCQCQLTLQ